MKSKTYPTPFPQGPNNRPLSGSPAQAFDVREKDEGHIRADMRVGDQIQSADGTPWDTKKVACLDYGYARARINEDPYGQDPDTFFGLEIFKANPTNFENSFIYLKTNELLEMVLLLPVEVRIDLLNAMSIRIKDESKK